MDITVENAVLNSSYADKVIEICGQFCHFGIVSTADVSDLHTLLEIIAATDHKDTVVAQLDRLDTWVQDARLSLKKYIDIKNRKPICDPSR